MADTEARSRFASARVARLATADAEGRPHLVPITFALLGAEDRIVFAVDHKPKKTMALKRLANIAANPAVSLLVDRFDEDWTQLWWARADGVASVDDGSLREPALDALVARYEQYRDRRPEGPVVVIEVARWSTWRSDQRSSGGGSR